MNVSRLFIFTLQLLGPLFANNSSIEVVEERGGTAISIPFLSLFFVPGGSMFPYPTRVLYFVNAL